MKTKKNSHSKVSVLRKHVTRHVRLAVVPHKANQYRPHLIRRYGLTVVLALVVVLQGGYNLSVSGNVLGARQNISTTDLLADTNQQRLQNGLPALKTNDELSQAAFLKAKDMFAHQYWAHVSPDGTTPWAWFAKVGYDYKYAGENLAKNFSSAGAATAAWMASSEHRRNILSSEYTDVGFAVVDGALGGKSTTLIVALYGQLDAAPVVAGASSVNTPVVQPAPSGLSPMTRFGVALQSVTPAALASVILLLSVAVIALTAHGYRKRLPLPIRRSWRYHHGLYKATGLMILAVMFVALYSGGQI